MLGAIKPLQPGLYVARVHEATSGPARADARKLFMISNIGLEAFSGKGGIAVEARLLSEARQAASIDVALISRNNREIARVRTDGDGIARFGEDQVSGRGQDAPAALYAYGADGEFTALPIDHAEHVSDPARAWIVTDRQVYKPGDDIRGVVLLRNVDAHDLDGGKVFAQLENPAGEVAENAGGAEGGRRHTPAYAPCGARWRLDDPRV